RQVEVTRGGVKGPDGEPMKGPDGKPMDVNDLFRAGLLPDDPFEGGEPMELSLDARGMRERVRELSREGKTIRAIAEELGIARGTVSYHMRDMRDGARGTMKSNDMRDGTNLPTEDLPTLALAVESFLDRQRTGAARVFFPWPGGQSDLPPDHAGRTEIPSGALLPAETRPRWEALWRKVGPLWPDRLAVMVGMPGRGKSGFALQVAEAVATAGHPVLYLSAEMGTDELVARLIALRAGGDERDLWGVAWRDVLMGRARREDLEEACAALQESCPALYPWAPQADHRTAGHLQRMAEAVSEARGNAPILVVLDYLQRMAEGDDLRGATRAVSGMLRDLSRPDGIGVGWPGAAVLALSTTARQNYRLMGSVDDLENAYLGPWQTEPNEMKGKGKPKRWRGAPENLEGTGKESGELEADASLLLVLATNTPKKEDAEPEPRKGLVVIPKNRSGSTGMIPFEFYPAPGRFVEPEKVHRSGGRLHETL
ncbi:AAA family ATPase, partial [Patescibacteria group bacterium]|nr:AAA family ATPase [Patescibacteria group bacterium]